MSGACLLLNFRPALPTPSWASFQGHPEVLQREPLVFDLRANLHHAQSQLRENLPILFSFSSFLVHLVLRSLISTSKMSLVLLPPQFTMNYPDRSLHGLHPAAHTDRHTNRHGHIDTLVHTDTQIHKDRCIDTYIHTQTHRQRYTRTDMNRHKIQTDVDRHTFIHRHRDRHMDTYRHTQTQIHRDRHEQTQMHTETHSHTQTHRHIHTQRHTQRHTDTKATHRCRHISTFIHTDTKTHRHTETYTQAQRYT